MPHMPNLPDGGEDTIGRIFAIVLSTAPLVAFLAAMLGLELVLRIALGVLVLAVLGAVVLGALAEDRRRALAKTIRDPLWLVGVGLIVLLLMVRAKW